MQIPNPFSTNPFTRSESVSLVTIPEAVETHEPLKSPKKIFGGAGAGGLEGLLGAGGRPPGKVEVHTTVYRDRPQAGAEDAAESSSGGSAKGEEFAASSGRRWGR